MKISDNVLCCEILIGDKARQLAYIHRILLTPERDYSFQFQRRQFPVKLAFAMRAEYIDMIIYTLNAKPGK